MEMHQIRYFLAVARSLNFTRAAEDLQIAQPSLTRAIHKLESELGGPLFRRERMNTHLTELGRLVLPDLQATLAAADAAKSRAQRLRSDDVGSLALGVSMGLDTNRVIEHVLDVAQKLSGLELSVEIDHAEAVSRRLIKGDFDAAILGVEHDAFDRLDLLPIETDIPVVAFAADHRFNREKAVDLQKVSAEPLAVCSHGWTDGALASLMEARGLPRRVQYRSNNPRWIADVVRRGLAVTLTALTTAQSLALCHRALAGVSLQQRSVLATVAGRRHSRAVTMLVKRIRKSDAPLIASAPEVCEAS